jgi:hypothetical protein
MMATYPRKESMWSGIRCQIPSLVSPTSGRKVLLRRGSPMATGQPRLGMFMLGFDQAIRRKVPAVMFGLVDECRAWFERGESLVPNLSIIVESRLKQKMQTRPYRLGRNPRVYPEQASSRTPLACSAEPTGSRRKRFCCVPPTVDQSLEKEQEQ